MSAHPFSRRDLLRGGRDLATLLSLSSLAGVESPLVTSAEAAQDTRRAAPDVYRSIGVKPVVNARGTFTIISGSLMLPEVRAAMDAAARQYVHLDELAEADRRAPRDADGRRVGARHSGMFGGVDARDRRLRCRRQSRSARAHSEPGRALRRTKSSSRVIRATSTTRRCAPSAHASSRSSSVARARSCARAEDGDDLRARGQRADQSVLNLKAIAQLANPKGVPILVDAAAEILTVPNVHLQNGADAGRLQRRQVSAWSADGGTAARPQGSRPRRMGAQRAASWPRARDEGREGRSHRHADGRRDVGEARPRRRMEAVDGVARSHLAPACRPSMA